VRTRFDKQGSTSRGNSFAMPKRKAGAAKEHSDEDEEIPANKKKASSGDEDSTIVCEVGLGF